jgi:phage pi2 protein 07
MTNILIEDIDSNELLPKTLNNWNNLNLVETYQYCKSQKIKNLIASEFWWRTEMLLLRNT